MPLIVLILLLLFVVPGSGTQTTTSMQVPYPEGYRQWTHVKTEVIGPKSPAFRRFGGFHHIYAYGSAMKGYSSGIFPDGSLLVFDVMETIEKDDGNTVEGERRFIDVMMKDSASYASTGGWGFEEFRGNSTAQRTIGKSANEKCFSRHAARRENDFVFSSFRK